MTGGLLQLVAIGIDSIFLTSNPSVTLFKIVYRRHTNFSLVNRTKQLSTINDFGIDGQYILQKEGDSIHKMFLNFDISDFVLEYPNPTSHNIQDTLIKYNVSGIDLSGNIIDNTQYINNILPQILDNVEYNVNENNNYYYYIQNNNALLTGYDGHKKELLAEFKYCLDKLIDSYNADIGSNENNDINDSDYDFIEMIAFKFNRIRDMISNVTYYSGNDINTVDSIGENYYYLDNGYFNDLFIITPNLSNIYQYAYNRHDNSENIVNTINNWVNDYLDKFFNNILQVINVKNIFLTSDNNLQNIRYYILKIIDLQNYLYDTVIYIINGNNPNTLSETDLILIKNQIAMFNDTINTIDNINNILIKNTYIKIQYKILFDYLYAKLDKLYNTIFPMFFNTDNTPIYNNITSELISIAEDYNQDAINELTYSMNSIYEVLTVSVSLLCSSYNMVQKFFFTISSKYDISSSTPPYIILTNMLFTYHEDLLNVSSNNERIYTVNEINDIMYNEYLSELTYSVLGLKIYDSSYNMILYDSSGTGLEFTISDPSGIVMSYSSLFEKINMMYLSFILMYIIEASIPNNKNMVDISNNSMGNVYSQSQYYGYKLIDYFNAIIESNDNPLVPILNFSNVETETIDYKKLDTYITLNKFLTDKNILYNEDVFNDTFIYSLTQTLKQNMFANIHILYNSILDNILSSARHNITQTTRIDPTTGIDYIYKNTNTTELITDNTDYYKFSYFKTFTNTISNTNKFTPLFGSNIIGLSDNVTNIFTPYQQNQNIYSVYFANDILNNYNTFNFNVSKYFENTYFTDYFNDMTVWQKLILGSSQSRGILQNLTFDRDSGDIVNMSYYFNDVSGVIARVNDITDPNYIDPGHNIYDKFILTQDNLVVNNMIILNYMPLHLIKDFADEIYTILTYEINNDKNTQSDKYFYNLSEYMYLFDFRDLNDYLINDTYGSSVNFPISSTEIYKYIRDNLIFKYDMYKTVILNSLLKINKNSDAVYGLPEKNFEDQVFNGNVFQLADSQYLYQFANTYLSDVDVAIISLMRPENLINITKGFENDVSVSSPEYDACGNVKLTYKTNTELYAPILRGIVERYRIKFLKIVDDNFDASGNPTNISGSPIGENGLLHLKNFINGVLNNYIKFDDINNIDIDNYSYTSYKSNGYSYNYIDFTTIDTTLDQKNNITIGNTNNIKIYKQQQYDFIQAPSSIYSYLNKLMIRDYNNLYNTTLLSDTYYENSLGQNMKKMYYFIKSQFLYSSGNNLPFYQQKQVPYYFSYRFNTNNINESQIINIYDQINLTSITDPSINPDSDIIKIITNNKDNNFSTYPVYINGYGFDYYSFGDEIKMFKNNTQYEIDVIQRVLYHTIYDPQFTNMTVLDYEYFFIMSFLGYDIRCSKTYDKIQTTNDFVYNVPQNIQYYSNLLRLRNKYISKDDAKKYTLSEIIDIFNDYNQDVSGYKYYSDAEITIAERVKQKILSKYKLIYDVIDGISTTDLTKMSITQFLHSFGGTSKVPFDLKETINGMREISYNPYTDIVNDNPLLTTDFYIFNDSYDLQNSAPYESFFNEALIIYDSIKEKIIDSLYNDPNQVNIFNNYQNKTDVILFIFVYFIKLSELSFYYDTLTPLITEYNNNIDLLLTTNKLNYYNNIIKLTQQINPITNNQIIKFKKNLPYIENLYNTPQFYSYTDIIYHGSELDILLRNIVNKTPVKYCWVSELGHYLLENISFYLDELLIDDTNSNLRSLLNKLKNDFEHSRGYNMMIGNIPELINYDTNNKGNFKLSIPIEFYFNKDASLSIPMINLLYTKGIIKFKLRNIEDLLIYDQNAILKKKPKIKTSMNIQYIYLEEEERKRVSSSKLEFLIERFRYGGIYNYNYSHIIDRKLRTQLKMADPTKYILWRFKVLYPTKIQNNYKWNSNGYNTFIPEKNKVTIYENIKTIDNIKVYFNGLTREQGTAQLFNLINPYGRLMGSLDNDEYIYIFALYPLLYQPSGTANLSNIEDIIVEFELNSNFIQSIIDNGLTMQIEYWSCTYNVLRFISGMCAPLFYI